MGTKQVYLGVLAGNCIVNRENALAGVILFGYSLTYTNALSYLTLKFVEKVRRVNSNFQDFKSNTLQ